ncbi:MAG: hypothetical protein ACI9YG_001717, partial [Candidatus Azotimanducaceae bacterium]
MRKCVVMRTRWQAVIMPENWTGRGAYFLQVFASVC